MLMIIVLIIPTIAFPRIFVLYMFFLLGVARVIHASNIDIEHIKYHLDNYLTIEAKVVSYPQIKNQEQILILQPRSIINKNVESKIKDGRVQLKLSKYFNINKGDVLKYSTLLESPENFDGFDYNEYLKSQNIYGLSKNPSNLVIFQGESLIENKITNLRKRIISEINTSFYDPHAKLLAGMLIGTREQFSPEFANNLSITSTSHVIAVSGYNISLIVVSILRCSGYINRRLLIYFTSLCLTFFIAIVGLDNLPALRAGIMGYVTLVSFLLGRRNSGVFVLLLVAGILHIHNPFTYRSLSFQLSFAATFGLMSFSALINTSISRILKMKIGEEIATTLTAMLLTFPVTFSNFGKITTYGLFANLLIAPLIPIITFLGIIFLLVNIMDTPITSVVRALLWGSLELMVRIINRIASLPYSDIVIDSNLDKVGIASMVLIAIIFFELKYRDYCIKND
jgi:competence protein ComEC